MENENYKRTRSVKTAEDYRKEGELKALRVEARPLASEFIRNPNMVTFAQFKDVAEELLNAANVDN